MSTPATTSPAAARRTTLRLALTLGLALSLVLPLAACHRQAAPELGASQLAEEGTRAFERHKWPKAVEDFQKVKDRYPFSPFALTAEIKIADALYMQEKYDESIAAFQEFERMHPRNEQVPYAIYMEGMGGYKQMLTMDRSQVPTSEALRNFQRLISDYPKSALVVEAKSKIGECQERMAAQELYVARWYLRTKHYRSALTRLNYLLANYAQTPSGAEGKALVPEVKAGVAQEMAKGEQPVDLAPGPARMGGGVGQSTGPMP